MSVNQEIQINATSIDDAVNMTEENKINNEDNENNEDLNNNENDEKIYIVEPENLITKIVIWAAKEEHPLAMYLMGLFFLGYYKINPDFEKAVYWFQMAIKYHANEDFGGVEYYLAHCYENGFGIEKDQNKAVELFHKAAEKGFPKAMKKLAVVYAKGLLGLNQDTNMAERWNENYENTDEYEWSLTRDLLEAGYTKEIFAGEEQLLEVLDDACQVGNVEAEYVLGLLYDVGFGGVIPVNPVLACECFEKASKAGHAGAMFCLAKYYEEGKTGATEEESIPRRPDLAMKLYKEAAHLGDVQAQEVIQKFKCMPMDRETREMVVEARRKREQEEKEEAEAAMEAARKKTYKYRRDSFKAKILTLGKVQNMFNNGNKNKEKDEQKETNKNKRSSSHHKKHDTHHRFIGIHNNRKSQDNHDKADDQQQQQQHQELEEQGNRLKNLDLMETEKIENQKEFVETETKPSEPITMTPPQSFDGFDNTHTKRNDMNTKVDSDVMTTDQNMYGYDYNNPNLYNGQDQKSNGKMSLIEEEEEIINSKINESNISEENFENANDHHINEDEAIMIKNTTILDNEEEEFKPSQEVFIEDEILNQNRVIQEEIPKLDNEDINKAINENILDNLNIKNNNNDMDDINVISFSKNEDKDKNSNLISLDINESEKVDLISLNINKNEETNEEKVLKQDNTENQKEMDENMKKEIIANEINEIKEEYNKTIPQQQEEKEQSIERNEQKEEKEQSIELSENNNESIENLLTHNTNTENDINDHVEKDINNSIKLDENENFVDAKDESKNVIINEKIDVNENDITQEKIDLKENEDEDKLNNINQENNENIMENSIHYSNNEETSKNKNFFNINEDNENNKSKSLIFDEDSQPNNLFNKEMDEQEENKENSLFNEEQNKQEVVFNDILNEEITKEQDKIIENEDNKDEVISLFENNNQEEYIDNDIDAQLLNINEENQPAEIQDNKISEEKKNAELPEIPGSKNKKNKKMDVKGSMNKLKSEIKEKNSSVRKSLNLGFKKISNKSSKIKEKLMKNKSNKNNKNKEN